MTRLVTALAVLAALIGGGVYLTYNYLDVVVKTVLEHWGPDVLGAPVKVAEVRISPQNGRGAIVGLEIGNPGGFSSRRAARFDEIRVSIDPRTLFDRVIVVREISVTAPQITYERGNKATNLDAIQAAIDAYAKQSNAPATKDDGKGPMAKRRFVIEKLEIRGARVLMTNSALKGQGLSFDLPEVQLRDMGKRQGGLTASEAAGEVARALQVRIAQKVLTNADLLRKGGVEGAVDALKGLLK